MSRIYPGRWSVLVKFDHGADAPAFWQVTEPAAYEDAERACLAFGLGVPFEGCRVVGALIIPADDAARALAGDVPPPLADPWPLDGRPELQAVRVKVATRYGDRWRDEGPARAGAWGAIGYTSPTRAARRAARELLRVVHVAGAIGGKAL